MADYKPGDLEYPTQESRKLFCKFHYKGVLLVLLPIIFSPILLGREVLAYRFIYISLVMYLYMILNLMTPGAVAFLYIVFIPICGIMSSKDVCVSHYSDLMYVTYGSVWIGLTFENTQLHKRWAIFLLKKLGSKLIILQLILMLTTALLSNITDATFTTGIMMKVAQALMTELNNAGICKSVSEEETYERGAKPYPSLPAIGMYLTICFSATTGAMASAYQEPNPTIFKLLDTALPTVKMNPGKIVTIFIIPMVVSLIVIFLWINIVFLGMLGGPVKKELKASKDAVTADDFKESLQNSSEKLGPWDIYSITTIVFLVLGGLLIAFRNPLFFSGWLSFVKEKPSLNSVPIIFICLLVFSVPANYIFCRYYVCREPEKKGPVNSMLLWKLVHSSTPWHWIFFLGAAYTAPIAAKHSKFLELLRKTLVRNKLSTTSGFLLGSFFTIFTPARSLVKNAFPDMFLAGFDSKAGLGGVAVPFVLAIHNSFLLPCSTAANIIIAGWGNVRPFQFLLGGIVPQIIMCIVFYVITITMAGSIFPGYKDNPDSENYTMPNFTTIQFS